jgi:hypothetical protein
MIELVGSKLVTQRPTDSDTVLDTMVASDENILSQFDDDDKANPQSHRTSTVDTDIEPYQTPLALTPRPANWKNKEKKKAREASDTDVESSDIDSEVVGGKKQSVSADKVRSGSTRVS